MTLKEAIKIATEACERHPEIGDRLANMIPATDEGNEMELEEAFHFAPELKACYDNERDSKEILDSAREIVEINRDKDIEE